MDNLILNYLIKVSVSIILFYGLYVALLRKDTFNQIKRFVLLFIILFSFLFSFCNINLLGHQTEIIQAWLPEIEITNSATQTATKIPINTYDIILCIFYLGSIVYIAKILLQIGSIISIKLKNRNEKLQNWTIVRIDENIVPFSFFRWIFIPRNAYRDKDLKAVIIHEKIHAQQYHSLDILVAELLCTLLWWNPIVWLLKRDIKINLEYLADQGTLEEGIDAKHYQYLLLQITNSNTSIEIVNKFNVSQLKERIIMINKPKSPNRKILKCLLILPLVAVILSTNASNSISNLIPTTDPSSEIYSPQPELNQQKKVDPSKMKNGVYTGVDEMPRFPGGESELMKFIGANLKYPEKAIKDQTEGRVVVQFIVSKTGKVRDIAVIRSLSPECDAEAVSVIESMPDWTPGKEKGQVVDVYYTLPIAYKLTKDTNK